MQYNGYAEYLDRAADAISAPLLGTVRNHSKQVAALHTLSSLIGQATYLDPVHRVPTYQRAVEFRDAIAVALEAADAILEDAHRGLFPDAADTCSPEPPIQRVRKKKR